MSENLFSNQEAELKIIQAKQSAEFSLTPVGQMLKQFEITQRIANMYTQSTIVPETYRGNIGNCVIALDMSMRMNANPLMIMQNLYVVHGNPAFSSKFLIATINTSGKFTPLRYEFKGTEGSPEYRCRCYAYEVADKERKEPLHGDWISLKMAEDEGWSKKAGSKWKTMPSQMLRYRAAAFWQRVYCPEISMGFLTKEEYEDIEDVEYTEIKNSSDKTIKHEEITSEDQENYYAECQFNPELAPEYFAQGKISKEQFDQVNKLLGKK